MALAFSNPHARVVVDTPVALVIELPDVPAGMSGTCVSVMLHDGLVTEVEASRSLHTSNELYLVPHGAGVALVVTDNFLTALNYCTPTQRTPDDDALIDHFLFRTVPADKTYARGVVRIGHGRGVRWDGRSARIETIRRQVLVRPSSVPFSEALRLLEQALEDVMGAMAEDTRSPATNLLSGGVDSTLLQTFLPPATPSISATIDTPEYALETERALLSSHLVGSQHHLFQLREAEYLDALKRFIATVGLPPHHMQSVMLAELFRLFTGDGSRLVTGQLADALFGLSSLTRRTAALRRWGWLPAITSRLRLPARVLPRRLRMAELWHSGLTQPIASTQGLAARAACYTDFEFLERSLGATEVHRRLADRLRYVLELCPFLSPTASGIEAQLEAAHLVDYFCDDGLSIWRQAAMSYRGYLIAPFTDPTIFRSSLMFSSRDRYWRQGEIKPALKTLLRKRLPAYDAGLPKLASGLPIARYLTSGPLRGIDLTPPEFLPRLPEGGYPVWIAWSILTLSLWRELLEGSLAALPMRSFVRTCPAVTP